MSHYEILQAIYIVGNKVYTVSADSNKRRPLQFSEQEQPDLTELLLSGGMYAVLKELGKEMFAGGLHIQPHNCYLAQLLKQAGDMLVAPLRYSLDTEHAASFIATVTDRLYHDPYFSPITERKKLEALRRDPDAVLSICTSNPAAFNYSDDSVRCNREVALRYVRQCATCAGFIFPNHFTRDKDLAIEALQFDGRIFYQLSPELRRDKDVVRYAYNSRIPRASFACMPRYIGTHLLQDPIFMREIVSICADFTMQDVPELLQDKAVAEAWIGHNHHALDQLDLLPEYLLNDQKIRNALYASTGANYTLRTKVNRMLSANSNKRIDAVTAT